MKILMLSESLAMGGGAEKFTVTLGNELSNRGHEIVYLTYFDSEPKYDFNGKYITFKEKIQRNFFSKAVNFFMKPFKIKKVCDNNNIDVVISVGEDPNVRSIISKIYGNKSKIIATHHLDPGIHLKHKVRGNEIKFLYPKSDKVVCVSKTIENTLKNKFGVDNTLTIYNMLDITECIEKSKEKLSIHDETIFDSGFVFVNLGRLSYQKGQWILIKSFKKVVDKYENSKLCILGDGELREDLLKLVKELKLENNVFLLGNQSNVFKFLNKSDCFVLSSLFEGFGLVLMEALCLNLPIISTDCKVGPREILCPELDIDQEIDYPYLGEYGILTEPDGKTDFQISNEYNHAEEMLYELMIKIIEDPDSRKKYSKGLKRAKYIDKDKIICKWEKLLIDL